MTTATSRIPAGGDRTLRLPALASGRKPMAIVLSSLVVIACGFGFAELYSSAARQHSVIVVTHTIEQGQTFTSADLAVAEVSTSGPVASIPVASAGMLAGRAAAVTIPAGSLLVAGDVARRSSSMAGLDAVGVTLKADQMPADGLVAGDVVSLVEVVPQSAGQTGLSTTLVASAKVVATSAPGSGAAYSQAVTVAVPQALAPAVAAAAAQDEICAVVVGPA